MSNNPNRHQRFADMLQQSRFDANKSIRQMAQLIHKSPTTIQNWESCIGCPTFLDLEEWFDSLGVNMGRYILNYLYPTDFKSTKYDTNLNDLRAAVALYVDSLPEQALRQLAFSMLGDTGSSFTEQVNMMTAHNHTTMRSRALASQIIYDNYLIEESRGELVCQEHISPDINALYKATMAGKQSAYDGVHGYNIKKEPQD